LEFTVAADQLNVVAELAVPEAVRPVGAAGLVVHPLDDVVALTAELGEELPAESVAATVKLYVVEGDKPVTE
jgi:hypothetical protein